MYGRPVRKHKNTERGEGEWKKTGGKEATEISKGAKEIRHMRRTVKGNMSNQKRRLKKPRFNYKCN